MEDLGTVSFGKPEPDAGPPGASDPDAAPAPENEAGAPLADGGVAQPAE